MRLLVHGFCTVAALLAACAGPALTAAAAAPTTRAAAEHSAPISTLAAAWGGDNRGLEIDTAPPATQPDAPPHDSAHKDLFPLNQDDWLGLALASLGLILAAGGGIGGGGMLVPIYVMVMRFAPKQAVALSNVTILGGAAANLFSNVFRRHPFADRPLVDWDLILIMEPPTIGGALIGSFLNKVLPEKIMVVSLVVLLLAMAYRTLTIGLRVYRKESKAKSTAKALAHAVTVSNSADEGGNGASGAAKPLPTVTTGTAGGETLSLTPPPSSDDEETVLESSIALLGGNSVGGPNTSLDTSRSYHSLRSFPLDTPGVANGGSDSGSDDGEGGMGGYGAMDEIEPALGKAGAKEALLEQLLEEERHVPKAKVLVLVFFFLVTLALNLVKGGGGVPSPLGFECGSVWFWLVVAATLGWVVVFSAIARHHLVQRQRTKAKAQYAYLEGDVQWTPHHATVFPALCFFAGLFAGLFGVGGGIVKGPLMLEMGVLPQVASATSACMILFTSFTASTSYLVFGLMKEDYAVLLVLLGLLATAVGQKLVAHIVKRSKRSSVIILIIGSVILVSAVLLGIASVQQMTSGKRHSGIDFCSAEA